MRQNIRRHRLLFFFYCIKSRLNFSYLIHCSNVVEYYVDSSDNHFHGDALVYNLLYSPIQLTRGSHRLYVKTISSIRAYGNTANVTFNCQVDLWRESIKVINTVVPSVVDQYVRNKNSILHATYPVVQTDRNALCIRLYFE